MGSSHRKKDQCFLVWKFPRIEAEHECQLKRKRKKSKRRVHFKNHTWVTGRSLACVLMVTKSFPIVRTVWMGQVEMFVFLQSPATWGDYNLAPTDKCNHSYKFILTKLLHLVMHSKWM